MVGRPVRQRAGSKTGGFGLSFAALALLCQLLSMLLAMPGAQAGTAPVASGAICRVGGAPVHDEAPAHRPADCALCPACLASALPFPVPVPAAVPAPILQPHHATLPPARAGPAAAEYRFAAQPRGPPVQA